MAVFERLRRRHAWALEWISAGRKGPVSFVDAPAWLAGAWCWLMDDGDERMLEMHVQLFKKEPDDPAGAKDFARLTRAFQDRLEPLGYARVKIRSPKKLLFAVFDKEVRTLAGARRERARLDRVLFGD